MDVKICGLKTPEAVEAVAASGASHIGLNFFPPSPRSITPEAAADLVAHVPDGVKVVALVVDADDALLQAIWDAARPDIFQLHGKIRSLRGVLAGPHSGSGHAWVRYESAEAVEAALATNGTVIGRRFLAVLRGSSRASRQTLRMRLSPSVAADARSGPRGPGPGRGGPPRTRVFVSSLPERTDEF